MVAKYPCQKCGRRNTAIRYGKFTLKNGKTVPRIRCLACKRTSFLPYREVFLNKMRVSGDVLYRALLMYIHGRQIKHIAEELNTRPNTVINWITKVCMQPNEYKEYIRKHRSFEEPNAYDFFNSLRHNVRRRVSRLRKDYLEDGLAEAFTYLDKPEKKTSIERYGNWAVYYDRMDDDILY